METLNRGMAAQSGVGAALGRVRGTVGGGARMPRAMPPPYAPPGPADFAQQETSSMVQVSAATRICIGCQWFYFSRDEYGYTVSSQQYPEWRLTIDDFAKLVGALSELLVEQTLEEQQEVHSELPDLTSPGSLLRQALARGYCSPANEKKTLDAELIEAMAREVEALQQFG